MNSTEAKRTLANYLKEKQLRFTKEREVILSEILHTSRHFDADELYANLRKKGIKVSRATVYNNLDLLVECGLVFKYRFGDNRSRYEKAAGRPRHDHLICLQCGGITEFVNDKLDKLQQEVCAQYNFRMHNATLQIFGICSKCAAEE